MGRKRSTNCMKVTIHISDKSERINATAAKTRNAQQAVGAPEPLGVSGPGLPAAWECKGRDSSTETR